MDAAGHSIRIAYIGGQPRRINERVIDGQWISYLEEHTETVRIPPLSLLKLFGGAEKVWLSRFPHSLDSLAEGLEGLCLKYRVDTVYMNLPTLLPYLLMARSYAGLNIGFVFLAHSVGSESWLRQWIFNAPFLSDKDTLLAATRTSKQALLHLSPRYGAAECIPLSTKLPGDAAFGPIFEGRRGDHLLSIGRLEEVKNIHVLLECFARMRERLPRLRLTVAGEYTGSSEQIETYRATLESIVLRHRLEESVAFVGPVDGETKEELFRSSDLLINLSTDPGETFGFNLLEAKAKGLPIVCTSWDGFQELVNDGEDGFLVPVDWEEGTPQIDETKTVERCLQLLEDAGLRRTLASRSYESAQAFDYRRHFPDIIRAAAVRSRRDIVAMPDAVKLAETRLCDLPSFYELDRLRELPFYQDSLLSIVSGNNSIMTDPAQWMPFAKPVIHHFAGRGEHAKL
ncbi:glycosyltransferase [Paenibacillus sp. NPDC058071]|uniref:glycosyltransferase n=1 Tax=Paenibacillus sp. NPDC058071 TaxID=3346326 RepID=UPI0036D97DD6